ncbi:amidase family protein [Deinococcus rubellus]|uniref:amidase family protein n=1 Tax=Deinococcus rubellus TaxID=1889240 RepID=UPI0031F117D7
MTPLPNVIDLDATELRGALGRDELKCSEVTNLYLQRISTFNPYLHAVITVNPDAERDAAVLDALAPEQRGPLHGVPILIKDNIDVAGLPTTAGSLVMKEHVPDLDAPLVARLRAAGAVILGKANMTEWANFMTLGMRNGYSSLGGATINPWDEALDTGGSSSGSGVAVAARLCAAAIGTETSGSVVSPAHQNGVIGLKPTMGLVPRTGIVPISHSQDTAGPITRSARDAALLMSVISGPDSRDPVTLQTPQVDFRLAAPSRPRKIALITDEQDVSEGNHQALEKMRSLLGQLEVTVQNEPFPSRAQLRQAGWMLDVLVYEFKGALNAYLSGVRCGPRTLEEVICLNDERPDECLHYGQNLLYAAQGTSGDEREAGYRTARERDLYLTRAAGFDPLFKEYDVVIFPGIHGFALPAKAGYPSLAVPLVSDERPAGVLMVAPPGHDAQLLNLAAQCELLMAVRIWPDITARMALGS